jgi:SAM-dependent methyltransferase
MNTTLGDELLRQAADSPRRSQGLIAQPERKPRVATASLLWRAYAIARRLLPPASLRRLLLTMSWAVHRIAWGHVWSTVAPEQALSLTRPHLVGFVRRNVPKGARAIDMGTGTGIMAHLAAAQAASVLAVDIARANLEVARRTCAADQNVEFVLGDALTVLDQRGPFDVGLLLGFLGFHVDPTAVLRRVRRGCSRILLEQPDFGANPLNFVRLAEGTPSWFDIEHLTEFTQPGLRACVEEAGFEVRECTAQNGAIQVVADSPGTEG